jgi:hypothetical protein
MALRPGEVVYAVPVEVYIRAQSAEQAVSTVRDCLAHGIVPRYKVAPESPGPVRKA